MRRVTSRSRFRCVGRVPHVLEKSTHYSKGLCGSEPYIELSSSSTKSTTPLGGRMGCGSGVLLHAISRIAMAGGQAVDPTF